MIEGRRRLAGVCLLASLALLVGCIGNADQGTDARIETAEDPGDETRLTLVDRNVSATGVVTWNGSQPSGSGPDCTSACEEIGFRLNTSPGGVPDALVVSATWDPYAMEHDHSGPRGAVNVTVLDAEGTELARGPAVWWSAAAVVEDPEPGRYTALIEASEAPTSYKGAIHVQQDPGGGENEPARDLLPDLVSQPVIHLTREDPGIVRGTPTSSGCDPHEQAEHEAESCLRFTTSIGNLGEGPLELRMSAENATRAIVRGLGAPVDASFTQAIHRTDGSRREVAVGQGEFHAAHGHYHKEGFASFTLYEHGPTTGERGEVVLEGHKSSWCLVDMGLNAPAAGAYTQTARYPIDGARTEPQTRSNCVAATPTRDMVTGVSPGWYDMYEWDQPDQYVEVSDLPEGTYELVTRADPEDQLLEADPANNAAGVVFEWTDGQPRVIERWSAGVPGR